MDEHDKIKQNSKIAFAEHRLEVLSGFRPAPEVVIEEIPKTRTRFPGTENDYWYLEHTNQIETSVIYELGPFSVFNTHLHLVPKELIEILTKKGKVEWVTERAISFKEYGDVFEALPGERHALVSLVDFTIKLRVKWQPGMLGWEALFSNIASKNNYLNK